MQHVSRAHCLPHMENGFLFPEREHAHVNEQGFFEEISSQSLCKRLKDVDGIFFRVVPI